MYYSSRPVVELDQVFPDIRPQIQPFLMPRKPLRTETNVHTLDPPPRTTLVACQSEVERVYLLVASSSRSSTFAPIDSCRMSTRKVSKTSTTPRAR